MKLPIFRFEPFFQSPIWGGTRLRTLLGKDSSGSGIIGESWEISDVVEHSSRVIGGPFDGVTLEQLAAEHRVPLMGEASLAEGRFPLLVKFIDARETLSVQVHPDGATAKRIGGTARPKTEAWYIIDCDPGAELYVGIKSGVTRENLRAAIIAGTVERYLNRVPVKPGDIVFLPAGTVHAIGKGIVLAEVQQPSATTYRMFDWSRVDANGRGRELHVDQALSSVHYDPGALMVAERPASGRPGLACPFFEMELMQLRPGESASISGDSGPIVLMGVQGGGGASVRSEGEALSVALGDTILIPACLSREVGISTADSVSLLVVRPGR